jgi:hypothetical protein
MKVLIYQPDYKAEEVYPWNKESQRKFSLDSADVELLESGEVLFQEGGCFTLEEEDEQ